MSRKRTSDPMTADDAAHLSGDELADLLDEYADGIESTSGDPSTTTTVRILREAAQRFREPH